MSTSSNQNSLTSTRPIDFTFCDIPQREYHQIYHENENSFAFSPRLWSKNIFSSYANQHSPTTIMAEGRKELTELMPEYFCHELSLKDIVRKDSDNSKLAKEVINDTKPDLKRKKKSTKKVPISRSVSLDTGVYILKMFVPSSLGSKKQKVSRSKSMGGLMKNIVDVEKRKTWFFVGNNKVSSGVGNHNSSCTTGDKNRYGDSMLKPNGCLFRSKTTNQRGCVFF